MGSTFVEFRNRGFEADDGALEIWLLLLVDAIDKLPSAPQWLKEVREEWYINATAVFGYGVMPGLDRVVTDSERRDVILDLCSKAMKQLNDYGPVITMSDLNSILMANERHMFTADAKTERFEKVGDYFTRLVRGELKPEENDARIWLHRRDG